MTTRKHFNESATKPKALRSHRCDVAPGVLTRIAVIALFVLAGASPSPAATLAIPATHPRTWYGNAQRLAQARAHFASSPFTPAGSDATDVNMHRALRGLLTSNAADCDAAVAHLVQWRFEAQGVGRRDALRQQGEGLLAIYDWCPRLDAPQVASLVERWNRRNPGHPCRRRARPAPTNATVRRRLRAL